MFDVEKIRADFPLLSTEVYGRPLVYLDSGATAQKPRCVIDTVDYLHRELNANIHRGVHRLAEEATERYEAARDRIRAFIGAAHREEEIFTRLEDFNDGPMYNDDIREIYATILKVMKEIRA